MGVSITSGLGLFKT